MNTIVIIGASASGKSTLQKMLIEHNNKYHKIVTYTTRPIRAGEVDNVDYHFVTQEVFNEMREKNLFAETAEYRGWSYGTALTDCTEENGVAVLTPSGLRTINKLGIKTTSIFLAVDRESRLIQCIRRGDNVDEAYRRNLSDVGQFDGVENEVDYVINNFKYRMNERQTLAQLLAILGGIE